MTVAAAMPRPVSAPPAIGAAGAPPFILPGEHFAAALLFLLAGSAAIVSNASLLAGGMYISPRVAGATHLFTLGWITTSIMGALYQFLPVALGRQIRWLRLAHVTFGIYVTGLALFIVGLTTGRMPVMLIGAATFGTGVLCFITNMIATLRRPERRDVTWWALTWATFYLAVTLVLGIVLAGNLRWGYLGAGRLGAIGVHLHIALAGWVLLVMIGVAQRLLPMFLLSHGAGDRHARAAVALVATGSGILATLHHAPSFVSRWLPAVLITAGCAAFLLQARAFYIRRHRRILDPGMRLAAAGLITVAIALLLAWPVMLSAGGVRLPVAYVMTLILGITLFIAAHYYKIVPFLVWYHRFGPLAGRQVVPRVNELYSARVATIAALLLVTGVVLLPSAVLAGSTLAVRVGGVVLAAGVTVETIQMTMLWRKQP